MGNLEFNTRARVVRKQAGQDSIGPIGLDAQSLARINSPISPPPGKMEVSERVPDVCIKTLDLSVKESRP